MNQDQAVSHKFGAAAKPVGLTAEIVVAYVANNNVPVADLPRLISDIHGALVGLTPSIEAIATDVLVPAVPVKKSVTADFIICLEDGKKFKSLRRHLAAAYDMTPAQYREKWNLQADYPMVAPNYSATRSALAKESGLGRKRAAKAVRTAKQPRKKIGLRFKKAEEMAVSSRV